MPSNASSQYALTDNTTIPAPDNSEYCKLADELQREIGSSGVSLADSTIEELVREVPGLLIFPWSLDALKQCDDKIQKEQIFEVAGKGSKRRIVTHNMMGFIGLGDGASLTIGSRFDRDGKNHFLRYLLERVFAINLFDLKTSSSREESVLDLLKYLFPHYLKRALAKGLYKEYRVVEHNDANSRGVIDVGRHIRGNIPFNGRIAYHTREYRYDNPLAELIRHAVEFIRLSNGGPGILSCDEEMKDAVAAICRATPSYDRNQRQRIVNANIKAVAHPYFVEYVPLQRLCLQILRQEKMWFNDVGEKIHGFLFDGAWLWEEYLATVLKNVNFANGRLVHARNKAGSDKNPIHLYPRNPNGRARGIRYPDFYLVEQDDRDGGNPVSHLVLDAKYKKVFKKDDEDDFNRADGVPDDGKSRGSVYISRDDRHQLISYLHVLAKDCKNSLAAVIAPCADGGGTTGSGDVRFVLDGCLGGCGGCMGAYVFPIPEACNYQVYCKQMSDLEMSFIKAKCLGATSVCPQGCRMI